jgi:hypothetical protein
MQFKSLEPGIEVGGGSLQAIVDGFSKYPSVAMKYLTKFGLVKADSTGKAAAIDPEGWYSQDAWLAAYEAIAKEVGFNSLYTIGKAIVEVTQIPKHVADIHAGLKSLDIIYHMNHRKNGRVLFNPDTGETLPGIGSYKYQPVAGEKSIVMVCDNPYPCDFDRGLVTGLAGRFEPQSSTRHDNDAACRKKGAESCTYIVRW